jgi:gliding motility-associated-like protein
VAVFEVKPLDTFNLTLNAIAPYAGKIVFDNIIYSTFPTTIKIVENSTHTAAEIHDTLHKFIKWKNYNTTANSIAPNINDSTITYAITKGNDTLEAYFDTLIIIPPYIFPNIFIPNAFSPNGDNKNDYFGIKDNYNGLVSQVVLKVFDRFGTILYDGNGLNTGWDGRFNGLPNDLGSYYYSIMVKYSNNVVKDFKGDLLLTR